MSHYKYDRLSAQDTSFLIFENEKPNIYMHISSTTIYKSGQLKTSQGGIDFNKLKEAVANTLHRIPRYRQKLMWIQENKSAVWVDDHQFNIDYHVRHTSLPKPGTMDQLKTLASRVTEVQLDRERPLWEMWIVEGLQNDRFGIICKVHHSIIDGMAGVELSQVLMSQDKNFVPDEPPIYFPRPVPSKRELKRDERRRYLTLPFKAASGFLKFRHSSDDFYGDVMTRVNALKETFKQMGSPSENPLNGPLGPHRILDWLSVPFEDVRALKNALNCTVNDVVLTVVTSAVRQFFLDRQVRPENITYRVAAPVSIRRNHDTSQMGNRVSAWSIRLPIEKPNAEAQLADLIHQTQAMKDSKQALGIEMIMSLAEWTPTLLVLGARTGGAANNTIVTNVPGPQFPLYLIGAEMEAIYPCVPLMDQMGIGIALMSYNGSIYWGFNCDYGQVSDISNFIKKIKLGFEHLAKLGKVTLSESFYAEETLEKLAKPKKTTRSASRKKASTNNASKQPDQTSQNASIAAKSKAKTTKAATKSTKARTKTPRKPIQRKRSIVSTIEKSTTEKPVTEKSTTDQITADQLATKKSTAEQLKATKSTAEQLKTTKSTTEPSNQPSAMTPLNKLAPLNGKKNQKEPALSISPKLVTDKAKSNAISRPQ